MNFKNLSLFSLLLVVSSHTIVRSEFENTYTDTAKLISRLKRAPMFSCKGGAASVIDGALLVWTCPVLIVSGICSNERREWGFSRRSPINWLVIDSVRHNLWYNDDKDLSSDESNISDVILEPIIFAAANKSLRVGLDKLNEYDVVKNITQSIPGDHDNLICRNSRMVAAAFVARGGRILFQEGVSGLNGENGTKFLKQAGMQVGSELTEVYIVNPIVDKVVGNDDCLSGDILKVGLNAAAFYALSSLVSDRK